MYYNMNLQPAVASKFATLLTNASIWNCIRVERGITKGIKFRVRDDKERDIVRNAFNSIKK